MDIEWIIYHLIHNDDDFQTANNLEVDTYNHDVFERLMVSLERNTTLQKICIERTVVLMTEGTDIDDEEEFDEDDDDDDMIFRSLGGDGNRRQQQQQQQQRRRTAEDMYYLLCTVCQLPHLKELNLIEFDTFDFNHPHHHHHQQQQQLTHHEEVEYNVGQSSETDKVIAEEEDGNEEKSIKEEESLSSSSSLEEEEIEDDDKVPSKETNEESSLSSSDDKEEEDEDEEEKDSTEDLMYLLSTCHNLTKVELQFSSHGTTTSAMEQCTIFMALASCPSLQTIQLELPTSAPLASLLLGGNNQDYHQQPQEEGGYTAATVTSKFKPKPKPLQSLTVDCYGGVPFDDNHIIPLSRALSMIPNNLQCLDLEHTLSPRGVLSIASMLRVNTTLTRLRLSLSNGTNGNGSTSPNRSDFEDFHQHHDVAPSQLQQQQQQYTTEELCLEIIHSITNNNDRHGNNSGLVHFHNYKASSMKISQVSVYKAQVFMLENNKTLEYFVLFQQNDEGHNDDDDDEDEELEEEKDNNYDIATSCRTSNKALSISKMRRMCKFYLKLNRGGRRFVFPPLDYSSPSPCYHKNNNKDDKERKRPSQQQQQYDIASKDVWIDRLIFHRNDVECLLYYLTMNPSLCKRVESVEWYSSREEIPGEEGGGEEEGISEGKLLDSEGPKSDGFSIATNSSVAIPGLPSLPRTKRDTQESLRSSNGSVLDDHVPGTSEWKTTTTTIFGFSPFVSIDNKDDDTGGGSTEYPNPKRSKR